MRQKLLLFHLCLVASLTSTARAAEPAYNYDVVADIHSHVSGIALLGFGVDRVAFSAFYALQPSCNSYNCMGYAVFDRDGVVAKTGDTISGLTLTDSIASAGINDEGTVLMQANVATGYGLFTNRSVVATTGDTIGGFYADGFFSEVINDSGNVAFVLDQAVILAKHRGKSSK
jgi:hypothetical protein